MTLSQAERICGYRIEVGTDSAGDFLRAWDGEQEVGFLRVKRDLKFSLGIMVEWFYREECRKVFAAQDWHCARCGERRPLQGHHIEYRSKGRVDRGNLEGVCAACHGREHGERSGRRRNEDAC